MAKRPKKETNSFILYYDLEDSLLCLKNKEDIADLFLAIFAYARRGVLPQFQNDALTALFMQVKVQLDINKEKWEHIKEVRSKAGKQGGKGNKKNILVDASVSDILLALQNTLQGYNENQMKANALFDNQSETNKAVNVNVDVNDTDTVSVTDSVSVNDNVNVNVGVNESERVNNINNIINRDRDNPSLSHSLPLLDDDKMICGEYMHVFLTRQQYSKLADDFGLDKTAEYIQRVDEYCQQTGKQYKDYYLTIRKWIKADEAEAREKEQEKKDRTKAEGQNSSLPPPEELERIMIEGATKKDLIGGNDTNEVTKK